MAADDTYTRTLRRAMELAGGETALAAALNTSAEVLSKWLSGELRPPLKMYFAALDIVTKQVATRRPG
jgi:hypothetical protein